MDSTAPRTIPFNKPFIAGKELYYIAQSVTLGNIAGDGLFTQRCTELMERRFGISRILLTPSCTAALEMAVLLWGLGPDDEVILPSYTFVSTANCFARVGARPVFVDIRPDTLNIDEALLDAAVSPRTRLIIAVHYGGVACEMDTILAIANRHGIPVLEDAAQGVHAYYRGRALGSLAPLGAYSFHATKSYTCGEGGALCINDTDLIARAEILRDKGTNRPGFLRGDVERYTWVDVGSSYVPTEIASAFLYAQLEMLDAIASRRRAIYEYYEARLKPLEERGLLRLPQIPESCTSNYHMYYVLLPDEHTRDGLMAFLAQQRIGTAFHYIPLHTSPMGQSFGYGAGMLPVTEELSVRVLRLPFYYDMTEEEQSFVVERVTEFLDRPRP
jgi:dTDP-4-amino-4,6-dideoxygalactose transaminase